MTVTEIDTNLERAFARELRNDDRCDGCIQQAVALIKIHVPGQDEPGEVLFCGHHWRKNRTKALANPNLLAVTEPDVFDPHTFGPPPTKETP